MARPKSDIDIRILHAARARFLSEGVDGASLRAIARDAGTSIGMVYYYFPTKDDLFLGVVEEIYERLLRDFEAALSPGTPVRDRLLRLYERIGRLSEEELMVVRLVVREALVSSARLNRVIERFRRGHIPLVVRTIIEGMTDGTLDRGRHPLILIASLVGVGLVPQVVLRIVGETLAVPGAPQGAALSAELLDVLLSGIGGHDRESKPSAG